LIKAGADRLFEDNPHASRLLIESILLCQSTG
jgi:hypothetical protein